MTSAKDLLRQFLLANQERILTSDELRSVAGISEWARRIRELRDEEGWPIATHNDSATLKPGEYMLTGPPPETTPIRFHRDISQKLRAQVLDRNGFTCQMCGKTPGEVDPDTGRLVRLHVGHILDKSFGGRDELGNLRTLCSTCNQGAKNLTAEKPSRIWLLSQVRRANNEDQRAIWDWLNRKFGSANP